MRVPDGKRPMLLLILLALVFAAPAQASTDATVRLSLRIAEEAFGPAPCGAPTVTVSPTTLVAPAPLPPDTPIVELAHGCTITLDPGHWFAMSFRHRCHAIVHGFGHLAGYGHADDPASVMWPRAYRGEVFQPCIAAARAARRLAKRQRAQWRSGRTYRPR